MNFTQFRIEKIPKHLKDRFKADCAQSGISMRKQLINLMEESVKKHESREKDRTTNES